MKNRLNDDIAFWHWARARQARGGTSWPSYWTTHFVWGLVTTVVDTGSIKLDWVNVGNNAVAIERSADGTTFTQVGTAAAGSETYTDTGLDTATDYWYRIRAFSGSNYGDYTAVQTDRTLPVSDKYPFVETTNWNNANHAIKDARLYVPDDTQVYTISFAGFDGTNYKINIDMGATEVVSYTYNASKFIDTDTWVKVDISRKATVDSNIHGWILINFGAITGGSQNKYTMPANLPSLVSSCIIEAADPVQTKGVDLALTPSYLIHDTDALYAHEGSVLATEDNILVCYSKNLVSASEGNANQAAILVTINKTTKEYTEQIIAKYNGTYGGFNFSTSAPVVVPRIYRLSSGVIRIYFYYNGLSYYRDYTEATNSLGDVTEFTAIISGGVAPVSLTAENLQAHCEAVTSEEETYFNALKFLFRNNDGFYDNGDGYLYCVGELLTDIANTVGDTTFPVFMRSADGGATWELRGIAYLPVVGAGAVPIYLESSLIYYTNKWYILSRRVDNYIDISESSDDGLTWANYVTSVNIVGLSFPHTNIGLRMAVKKSGNAHLLAYNFRTLEYRASATARNALAISYITKMGNNKIRGIANTSTLIHYPAFDIYDNVLYMVYTTGELAGGAKDAIKNAIRLVEIPMKDI